MLKEIPKDKKKEFATKVTHFCEENLKIRSFYRWSPEMVNFYLLQTGQLCIAGDMYIDTGDKRKAASYYAFFAVLFYLLKGLKFYSSE